MPKEKKINNEKIVNQLFNCFKEIIKEAAFHEIVQNQRTDKHVQNQAPLTIEVGLLIAQELKNKELTALGISMIKNISTLRHRINSEEIAINIFQNWHKNFFNKQRTEKIINKLKKVDLYNPNILKSDINQFLCNELIKNSNIPTGRHPDLASKIRKCIICYWQGSFYDKRIIHEVYDAALTLRKNLTFGNCCTKKEGLVFANGLLKKIKKNQPILLNKKFATILDFLLEREFYLKATEELKQKIICGEKIEKKFIAEQTIDNLSPNFPTNHTDEASKIIFQYFYNNTKIDPRKMNAVLNFLLNRIDLFKRLSNHSPPQLSKISTPFHGISENFKKDVASFFKLLFLPDFVFAASSPLLDSNEPPLQDSIFSYS